MKKPSIQMRSCASVVTPLVLVLALALGAGVSTGCAVHQAQWAQDAPPPQTDLVVASMRVLQERSLSDRGLFMTSAMIEDFASSAEPALTEFLESLGFAPRYDDDAADALDALAPRGDSALTQRLSGVWGHPRTSLFSFDSERTRNIDKHAARALAAASDAPLFASITVAIREDRNLVVMRAPLVHLSLRIVDREGRALLAAKTSGRGELNALIADRSDANLRRALDDALDEARTRLLATAQPSQEPR